MTTKYQVPTISNFWEKNNCFLAKIFNREMQVKNIIITWHINIYDQKKLFKNRKVYINLTKMVYYPISMQN